MYCTQCGQRNGDEAAFCAACGKSILQPVGTAPGSTVPLTLATDVRADIQDPKLVGVGGWLAFLVIVLVAVGPILLLMNFYNEYKILAPLIQTSKLARQVLYIEALSAVTLAAGSAYAGWCLATRATGAPGFVRAFLAFQVVATALTFLSLAKLPGLDQQAMSGFSADAVKGVFQSLFSAAIWTSYLNRSKRVCATYSLPLLEDWASSHGIGFGSAILIGSMAAGLAVIAFQML
ncbi:DUF2569 family protein [Delftia sp. JD2]|uniref:DUF2569 family protein n=1 Tax=Delftia sp. JD2 TaxID=469553 RepID=UPI001586B078|nr:DUF2569 family protein [Delftia sp. JD2]